MRRLVGLVSDETSESQSAWTAREYLSYFARIRRLPNPDKEVERILEDVGLEPQFRRKLISTYSTGMKRRVEIARALMGSPKVLFLDEPTRGLDLPAKREMWNLLRRLAARENVTTFLSSHDAQEIRSLCSQISVIAKGRLVYTGATQELGRDIDEFEERLVELLTTLSPTEPQDCISAPAESAPQVSSKRGEVAEKCLGTGLQVSSKQADDFPNWKITRRRTIWFTRMGLGV